MMIEDWDLFEKRWQLSLYIQERNEREGLDTPEKRLAALNERMVAAMKAERVRVAREGKEEAA